MQKSLSIGLLITIFISLSARAWSQTIPDVKVVNEFGQERRLSSYLDEKSILVMGYYNCRHICHFVTKNLSSQLRTFKDYPNVVFFGIDETEGPRNALRLRKRIIGSEKEHWSFLVAEKKAIETLARELDYEMNRDPVSGTITHEMGLYLVAQNKVMKKIPELVVAEKDLDFDHPGALHAVKKFCSEFDPRKSKYGSLVLNGLTFACVVFMVVAVGGFKRLRRKP